MKEYTFKQLPEWTPKEFTDEQLLDSFIKSCDYKLGNETINLLKENLEYFIASQIFDDYFKQSLEEKYHKAAQLILSTTNNIKNDLVLIEKSFIKYNKVFIYLNFSIVYGEVIYIDFRNNKYIIDEQCLYGALFENDLIMNGMINTNGIYLFKKEIQKIISELFFDKYIVEEKNETNKKEDLINKFYKVFNNQ